MGRGRGKAQPLLGLKCKSKQDERNCPDQWPRLRICIIEINDSRINEVGHLAKSLSHPLGMEHYAIVLVLQETG